MISDKPWTLDALMRLAASVLICVFFIGTTAGAVMHFLAQAQGANAVAFFACAIGTIACVLGALVLLNRAWQVETLMRRLTALLVCVYAALALVWLTIRLSGAEAPGPGNATARIIAAVLGFQGATLILVHRFLREHRTGWVDGFGFNREWPQALLLGFAVGTSAIPVGWGLQLLSGSVLDYLNVSTPEQHAVQVLRSAATWSNQLVLGFTAIVLAPIAEEVLFRGLMYPAIKQRGYPRAAVWFTSILFGAIHGNLATFLPLTLLALALVWLYERTDNLLAPIMAHSVFNTVNFVMLFVLDAAGPVPGPR